MSTSTLLPSSSLGSPNSALVFHPPQHEPSTEPPKSDGPLVIPLPLSKPFRRPRTAPSDLTARRDPLLRHLSDPLLLTQPESHPVQSVAPIEMTPVVLSEGVRIGQTPGHGETDGRKPNADRGKEEAAMAKWRRWIVEQPMQAVPLAQTTSKSARTTPASQAIPLVPVALTHSPLSPSMSSARTQSQPPRLPSGTGSGDTNPSRVASPRISTGDIETYHTDSVRALADVELAVDQSVLARAERRKGSRVISNQVRVSDLDNPFVDVSSRLGSRRVRPIVLELIQALGHYIDAVWHTTYPGRACPWVETQASSSSPSRHLPRFEGWTSRMMTAVQAGKSSGHVRDPPDAVDVEFWQAEVKHSLRDVDEVVGICKGIGWAFSIAMANGAYGDVSRQNTVVADGEAGNMARLLNDLEEAIWGDASPRSTDLAYDLPIDFDRYAAPDPNEQPGASGGLSSFFSSNVQAAPRGSVQVSPVPEEIYDMPDLVEVGSEGASPPLSSPLGDDRGDFFASTSGDGMTLEEIGKRRHREWVEMTEREKGERNRRAGLGV